MYYKQCCKETTLKFLSRLGYFPEHSYIAMEHKHMISGRVRWLGYLSQQMPTLLTRWRSSFVYPPATLYSL